MTGTIFDIKERVRQSFNYFIEESGIENYYQININKIDLQDDDLEGYFITVVNIISAIFPFCPTEKFIQKIYKKL